ncbi:hypothetical protein IWZ01DRAFT_108925 [Phyllosticta capitalensis]
MVTDCKVGWAAVVSHCLPSPRQYILRQTNTVIIHLLSLCLALFWSGGKHIGGQLFFFFSKLSVFWLAKHFALLLGTHAVVVPHSETPHAQLSSTTTPSPFDWCVVLLVSSFSFLLLFFFLPTLSSNPPPKPGPCRIILRIGGVIVSK